MNVIIPPPASADTGVPTIDWQIAVANLASLPDAEQMECWVAHALQGHPPAELTIRIVEATESATLNERYRGKKGPTNVLSFPFDAPPGLPAGVVLPLGDLVICAEVVAREAQAQNKPLFHHWAHIVVHGVLHLLGYDHITEPQAQEMEALEIAILHQLNIDNPYEVPPV